MRTEQRKCGQCKSLTEHALIGFVPQEMFEDTGSHQWIKATVCSSCGTLNAQSISEREMDWAERRFLYALVDTGNMSREEAKEILDS